MPKDDGKPGESLQETSTSELKQTHKDLMFRMKDSPENPTLQRRHESIVAELKRRGEDVMSKSGAIDVLADYLSKGGPYLGPQGGEYADPEHKIPWNPDKHGSRRYGKTPEKKPLTAAQKDAKTKLDALPVGTELTYTFEVKGGAYPSAPHETKVVKQSDGKWGGTGASKGYAESSELIARGIGVTDGTSHKIIGVQKPSMQKSEGLEGLTDYLSKGGPYYGPQGGMYADPEHKVHWDPKVHGAGAKKQAEAGKPAEGGAAPTLASASQLLSMGIKQQDTAAVNKAVSALKQVAKQRGMKAKATAELRSQLKEARALAKTMVGRYEADRRRSTPVAGREAYTHEHVNRARDIRDTIDEARAEVAAAGKSEATKQKQAAKANTQQINYRRKAVEKELDHVRRALDGQQVPSILVMGGIREASSRFKEIAELHSEAGNADEAKKYQGMSKLASDAWTTLRNKDATPEQRDKMRQNLRVITGREEYKPQAETKPEPKAEASGQLILPGMEKSEAAMGLQGLTDFLEKAEGMPTHQPKMGAGKSDMCGGTADGGELAGKGKLGGSATAPHYINKAKPDAEDQLSEDDAKDEKQMKPHSKPIEKIKKSDEAPHERLSGDHARQEAIERERLEKGVPDVQWSPYRVRERADADVQELLKSDFYAGGAPSLSPIRAPIHQGVLCKSCDTTHTAALTSCPNCGDNTTSYRSLPGAEMTSGQLRVEPSRAPLLRPSRRVADVKIGG